MTIKPGAIRFNTDSMKLEIFRGSANYEGTASMAGIGTLAAGQWEEIQATSPEVQTGGTRGVFWRGFASPANTNRIDYINVDVTGNAIDFGDALASARQGGACGSRVRSFCVGRDSANNTIETLVFASTGNSTDFGNSTVSRNGSPAGGSNSTRGLFAGGGAPTTTNIIDYITMASTGDAVDFGDLTVARTDDPNGLSSPTRFLIGGGSSTPASVIENVIDYVTISTLGNAADFGDLTIVRDSAAAASNAIRGLFGGGRTTPVHTSSNVIDYVTIATLGNAKDFGDLTAACQIAGACSSPTRYVRALGYDGSYVNTIDYVQIMTTGDAVDFGDTTQVRGQNPGASNGHGGL